jgi:hypothetical protein
MVKLATKPVKLRDGADGLVDRVVDLTLGDFAALRQIAEREMQIRVFEKEYRRLLARGLVTHLFVKDDSGFPVALARLTAAGQEALTQA